MGELLPIHSLKRNQTIFSQLAKQSSRVLPADLCSDHTHYVIDQRSKVLRRNKIMVVEGGIVSHYYILVICNLTDFMSLFRRSVCFALNFFFLTIFLRRVWNMQPIAAYR